MSTGFQSKLQSNNLISRSLTIKLVVIVCAMFAFGYALVPLYKAICDITGINVLAFQEQVNRKSATPSNTQVDTSRTIVVDFDASDAGKAKDTNAVWRFTPAQRSIKVHPGELVTVNYELTNLLDKAVVGQAIPSYLPARAASYFNKLECFCFKQQTLAANEVKVFPVVFSIDADLGKDVTSITLSYTFFEVKGAQPIVPPAASASKVTS